MAARRTLGVGLAFLPRRPRRAHLLGLPLLLYTFPSTPLQSRAGPPAPDRRSTLAPPWAAVSPSEVAKWGNEHSL